jgi:hypothetical protein
VTAVLFAFNGLTPFSQKAAAGLKTILIIFEVTTMKAANSQSAQYLGEMERSGFLTGQDIGLSAASQQRSSNPCPRLEVHRQGVCDDWMNWTSDQPPHGLQHLSCRV